MKNTLKLKVSLYLLAVACFTSGCLVINVEKNEAPKKQLPAKEINVDEAVEHGGH